jgi:hypothetical protein
VRRSEAESPYAALAARWGLGGVTNELDLIANAGTDRTPGEAWRLGIAIRDYLEAFPPADLSEVYRDSPCPDELPDDLGPCEPSEVTAELVREAVSAKLAAEVGWPHMATASAHRVASLAYRLVEVLGSARSHSVPDEEADEPIDVLLERLRSRRRARRSRP